ncbi:MAG: aldo/keto reductase, partial [Pseudonocardiaceae bacterium]
GDHRLRKRWFTSDALAVLTEGLNELREHFGPHATDLVRIALWSCLERSENAAVLVGFSTPEQISMNFSNLGPQPSTARLATAREIMGRVQARLDASGEVFIDEQAVAS